MKAEAVTLQRQPVEEAGAVTPPGGSRSLPLVVEARQPGPGEPVTFNDVIDRLAERIAARLVANTPLPRLCFNRNEAAKILGVSVRTLDSLTARGLLQPNRTTGRPLYTMAELQRFLAATAPRSL